MNKNQPVGVKAWLPVAVWMGVIFSFSTDYFSGRNTYAFLAPLFASLFPSLSAAQIDTIHLGLRKFGHWSEYFILAVLLLRALRVNFPRRSQLNRFGWCVALATLYAAGDEWHQSFVPSRTASICDVMIDAFGAICGTIWLSLRGPQLTPKKNRP